LKLEELIQKLNTFSPETEICLAIKTNITSGGKRVDFVYEIEGIETILQVGDSKIIAITANHLKQTLRFK
jgi:hypothetical protein